MSRPPDAGTLKGSVALGFEGLPEGRGHSSKVSGGGRVVGLASVARWRSGKHGGKAAALS